MWNSTGEIPKFNRFYFSRNYPFFRPFSQRVTSRERPWKVNSKHKPDYLDYYDENLKTSPDKDEIIGNCFENFKQNERKELEDWYKPISKGDPLAVGMEIISDKYKYIKELLNDSK